MSFSVETENTENAMFRWTESTFWDFLTWFIVHASTQICWGVFLYTLDTKNMLFISKLNLYYWIKYNFGRPYCSFKELQSATKFFFVLTRYILLKCLFSQIDSFNDGIDSKHLKKCDDSTTVDISSLESPDNTDEGNSLTNL